ncbi:unnamed protein product [Mycena citricolor]|uniref:Uncharacterized protein n=1 Tax=Mycena citricolor TaxID=2018698 RepID=A0AAD2HFB1_9AGAR|nr:unnamed protein product [Mycena citricolor]
MAVKTHSWVSLWFLVTAPVVAWDIGYCFMRHAPRSMIGGDFALDLEALCAYQNVDLVYASWAALERGGWVHQCQTPMIGFAAATMTLSKTVLYWAQEYYCNYCAVGHKLHQRPDPALDHPQRVSLLGPIRSAPRCPSFASGCGSSSPRVIVWRLGKDIAGQLTLAHNVAVKSASGKKQVN